MRACCAALPIAPPQDARRPQGRARSAYCCASFPAAYGPHGAAGPRRTSVVVERATSMYRTLLLVKPPSSRKSLVKLLVPDPQSRLSLIGTAGFEPATP